MFAIPPEKVVPQGQVPGLRPMGHCLHPAWGLTDPDTYGRGPRSCPFAPKAISWLRVNSELINHSILNYGTK
jgi:hypothetical protein